MDLEEVRSDRRWYERGSANILRGLSFFIHWEKGYNLVFLLVGLLISHVSSSSKTRTSLTLSPSCSLIYSRVKGPPPVAVSLAPLTNGVRIGETSYRLGGLLGLQPPAHSFTLLCICYLHNLFHVGTSPCACLSTVLQLAIMHLPPPVDSSGDTRQHNEAASWRRRVRHKRAIYHLLTTYKQQVIVDNFNSYRTRNLLKNVTLAAESVFHHFNDMN
jgi:hypothetical protein